ENIRAQRNKLTRDQVEEGRRLKVELKEKEEILREVDAEFNQLMLKVPNPSAPDVKVGGEKDNEVIRTVGAPRNFDFPVKDHVDIGRLTDTIDMERGAKVAQSGFYYMKGDGALLELALANFALAKLVDKGFVPVL